MDLRRNFGLLRLTLAILLGMEGHVAIAQDSTPSQMMAALHAQDVSVARAGYRLAVASAPLCTRAAWASGMTVQLLNQYQARFRSVVSSDLHIGDLPTLAVVVPDSPAARSGLREGDQIVAIGTHSFTKTPAKTGEGDFATVDAALNAIDMALSNGPAALQIRRGEQVLQISLTPVKACRGRFDVRPGRAMNAYSDGTYVQVSSDLVDFARNEGELAAVMAHELSHNILEHPQQLEAKGGHRPSIRATEVQADRLSVYLLVLAGYGVDDAVAFWSRFGRERGHGIFADGTHPGWRKRVVTIQAAAASIAALRAAGEPIRPPADLQQPVG